MLRNSLPTIITDKVPGPNACVLLKKRDNALPKALCGYTYPICIKRGEGAMLEDVDGNIFLDFIGGVGVLNIGYSRPEVVKAVQDQAEKYFHCIFNVVAHSGYIELADRLNKLMPCKGDKLKTFFANSGAEADENAVKIAKAYTGRKGIICFSGAFHGRTNLTMALTAKKSYAKGMGPFPSDIYRAEFPYLYHAPKGYSEQEAIAYYLDKLNTLFDEAAPDIIATAKSLGGGVPISAITAREEIMDSVPVGTIGGTYCGNPLACASALKVMDIMLEEDYAGKAEEIGKKATIFFSGLKEKYEEVGDVRGLGSMLGVEFVKTKAEKEPNGELVSKVIQNALQMGLMLENAGTHGNVIRFLVPLCVTDEQLEKGFEIFETALVKAKSDK